MPQGELSHLSSGHSERRSAHPAPTRAPFVLLRGFDLQPGCGPPLLLLCCVALASLGLRLGLGRHRAGLASPQGPPALTPLALGPAAVRPAPVRAPAAVLRDDGDHPHPPGRLPHPLQLRGVRGAVPSAAARREASLQAGAGLGAEALGGRVPAPGWAEAPGFSLGQGAGHDVSAASGRQAGTECIREPPSPGSAGVDLTRVV